MFWMSMFLGHIALPTYCNPLRLWVEAQYNGYAEDGHSDHRDNYIRDVGPRNYPPTKWESVATTRRAS